MSSHSFDIHIAEEHTLEVAVLVHHFHYWIMKNKRLKKNNHEGKTWTYQSYDDICATFIYWSRDQVKRLLKKCIDSGILVKRNFNKNAYDQTLWYAFKDEEKFGISRIQEMHDLEENRDNGRNRPIEKADSPDQKGEIAQPIPDSVTYMKTDKRECNASPAPQASQHNIHCQPLHGPLQPSSNKKDKIAYRDNIFLTEEDFKKIEAKQGTEKLNGMLDVLSAKRRDKKYSYNLEDFMPGGWIEDAYLKQKSSNKFSNGNQAEEDEKLAKKIYEKLKHQNPIGAVLGYNYIEFVYGSYSKHLKFGCKDFSKECARNIRDKKILKEIL